MAACSLLLGWTRLRCLISPWKDGAGRSWCHLEIIWSAADKSTPESEWIWVGFDFEPLFPIFHLVVVEWGDSLLVDLWLERVFDWRESRKKSKS